MGNRGTLTHTWPLLSLPDSVKDGRMTQGSQSESTPGQRPDPSLTPAKPFPPALRQLSGASGHLQPRTANHQHVLLPCRQQPSCHRSCLRSCGSSLKTEMWENGGWGGGTAALHSPGGRGAFRGCHQGPPVQEEALSHPSRNPLLPLWGLHPQGLPTTSKLRTRFGK